MALGEYLGAGSGVTKMLYRMNGNANDSSGNSATGTATNITWVNGPIGSQCAEFGGTNSKIAYTDGNTYSAFTLSVWLYADTYTGTKVAFMSGDQDYFCQIESTGRINFATQTSGYNYLQSSTGAVTTGAWYHAAFVYDGSNKYIYVNGQQVASASGLSGSIVSSGTVKIGVYVDDSYGWWDGKMDEYIIESVGWSQSKIQKYIANTKGRYAIL